LKNKEVEGKPWLTARSELLGRMYNSFEIRVNKGIRAATKLGQLNRMTMWGKRDGGGVAHLEKPEKGRTQVDEGEMTLNKAESIGVL